MLRKLAFYLYIYFFSILVLVSQTDFAFHILFQQKENFKAAKICYIILFYFVLYYIMLYNFILLCEVQHVQWMCYMCLLQRNLVRFLYLNFLHRTHMWGCASVQKVNVTGYSINRKINTPKGTWSDAIHPRRVKKPSKQTTKPLILLYNLLRNIHVRKLESGSNF